jgi:hypothetical protein
MKTKIAATKPRKISTATSRAACVIDHDGERIVDALLDIYDGKQSADSLRRYADWLVKAAKWLEDDA